MSQQIESGPLVGKRPTWRRAVVLALLWAAAVYFWIVPLFAPRGELGWGHYRLRDLILGFPIALAALWMSGVWLAPARFHRALQLRLITALLATGITLGLFDAVWLLGIQKVWKGNVWYDELGVSPAYNPADPELGYRRKPHLKLQGSMNLTYGQALEWSKRSIEYRSDENGFRNPAGVRQADVVFIGDSFTEAPQVAEEETFARRVEAKSGLQVVNLGLSGYGPQQELIVLRRFGLAYRPRFVVWQLWEGNDLEDAERYRRWQKNPNGSRESLTARIYSKSLLMRLLSMMEHRLPREEDPRDINFLEATLRQTDGQRVRLTRDPVYAADAEERDPVGLAETRKALEEGYRLCRSKGIELVVVFVPLRSRVLEPYVEYDTPEAKERAFPGGSTLNLRDMDTRLAAFCRQLGCSTIDLFPAMRVAAARDNRRVYLVRDTHLDVDGHEVVAQQVARWLASVNGRGEKESTDEERALADHPGRPVADRRWGEAVPRDRL